MSKIVDQLIEVLEPQVPTLAEIVNDLLDWSPDGRVSMTPSAETAFNLRIVELLMGLADTPPPDVVPWDHTKRCAGLAFAYAINAEVQTELIARFGYRIGDAVLAMRADLAAVTPVGCA